MAAVSVSSIPTAHRYAHLYPPMSFFHLSDASTTEMHGHAHTQMMWSLLHGAPPPVHLFTSSVHAQHFQTGIMQQQQQQPPDHPQPAATMPQSTEHSSAPTAVTKENPSTSPSPSNSSLLPVPVESSVPATADDNLPHTATGLNYSKEQLLALFRPSATPATASVVALKSTPSWLASCISSTPLLPVACSEPDANQRALQQELDRDADMTGVKEYSKEWWLPSYAELAKGKGRDSHRSGGKGNQRGNSYNNRRQSYDRSQGVRKFNPYQANLQVAAAAVGALPNVPSIPSAPTPNHAASTTPNSVAPSPDSTILGLGRNPNSNKQKNKRTHSSATSGSPVESEQQSKRQYAQTSIGKLFQ